MARKCWSYVQHIRQLSAKNCWIGWSCSSNEAAGSPFTAQCCFHIKGFQSSAASTVVLIDSTKTKCAGGGLSFFLSFEEPAIHYPERKELHVRVACKQQTYRINTNIMVMLSEVHHASQIKCLPMAGQMYCIFDVQHAYSSINRSLSWTLWQDTKGGFENG